MIIVYFSKEYMLPIFSICIIQAPAFYKLEPYIQQLQFDRKKGLPK